MGTLTTVPDCETCQVKTQPTTLQTYVWKHMLYLVAETKCPKCGKVYSVGFSSDEMIAKARHVPDDHFHVNLEDKVEPPAPQLDDNTDGMSIN